MIEFLMPKLGADMTAGTLVSWHKQVGEAVRRGDVIAEVDTEKGIIDVEIFTNGILEKLLARPGDQVPVGAPLALIRESTDGKAPVPPLPTNPELSNVAPAQQPIAPEFDVARAPATASSEDRIARMRQTIAAAMSRSKREIPHYYLGTTIDMDRSLKWLAEQNSNRPVTDRILAGALVLKAVALALRKYPQLNSVWENDRAAIQPDVHVGVAISLKQGGLIAPAIRHADRLSLNELMAAFRDLVNRTRSGSLKSSELSDPTTTVTNLGEQGVETVLGVIYPPQTSLFGIGRIAERPWAVSGQVVVRPIMAVSLSGDHRATDGHYGGRALNEIDRLLQEPEKL